MGEFGKTFEEAVQMYLDHHAAYSTDSRTAQSKAHVLGPEFSGASMPLTREAITAFVARRRSGGASGATINRDLAMLSKLHTLAGVSNPCHGIRRFPENGRVRWLTEDEARMLVAELVPRARRLVLVGIYTGGRDAELKALRWRDVEMLPAPIDVGEGRMIHGHVHFRSSTTKSRQHRSIPICDRLAQILRCMERGAPDDRLFQFRSIRTAFENARRRAGLGPDVNFHCATRHTFGSWYMLNGGDLYELKHLMGHSSVLVTQKYAHLSPRHLRKSAAFFGPPRKA